MPYIKKDRREVLYNGATPTSPGELNYCLTKLVTKYLDSKGLCYTTINDILGALEGCKSEFYRRVAAPYEENKINENGDVY